MNKKGFTLVELLATIIILGLLALLASTSVTKVLKESKGDLYTTQIKLVESAAEAWGAENIDKLPDDNECKYLTIKNLQDYGLIDKDLKNPKTNKEIDNNIKIKITTKTTGYGNSRTDYEVNPDNIEGCSHAMPCTLISGEAYTIGAKYECDFGDGARNFYILELGTNPVNSNLEEDEVALILEGNYDTTTQYWCDPDGDNPMNSHLCNADGLTAKLDEIATAWTELERDQIGLPSMEQIMVADGKSETAYTGYPSLSNAWLYNWDNSVWGDTVDGYWSSSPTGFDSDCAWRVGCYGIVGSYDVDFGDVFGVRPVVNLKI